MSNLLKDASILLTPTGYDNGSMNAIKPYKDLYGPELVTNGDFATDSNWTKGIGWSISNSIASCDGTQTSNSTLTQQNGILGVSLDLVVGKTYKMEFNIVVSSGFITNIEVGGNYKYPALSSSGTYTFYFTPTSTNDRITFTANPSFQGSIDNVSVVEDLTGDFQFSRSSAATRVNAQGLVENVQILSSELVSNGDFSQIGTEEVLNGNFSQEGSELVVNGDFATDTNWTKGTGWSIKDGIATLDGTQTGSSSLSSNIMSVVSGKTYKIVVNVLSTSSGFRLYDSNGVIDYNLSVGENVFYRTVSSSSYQVIPLGLSGTTGSIDNVSVKEVAQNWTLGTGWSIGENKAVATNSASGQKLRQAGQLTASKTYKLVYEITELTLGGFLPIVGAVAGTAVYSIGTYTEYITTINDDFYIRTLGTTSGSITNISVKEVGQDWTFGTGWSMEDGKAIHTGVQSLLTQNNVFTSGIKYKISFDLTGADSFNYVRLLPSHYTGGRNFTTSGTNVVYVTANVSALYIYGVGDVSIDNISVVQVTDDTDLPRINYSGFSYQDSLGSEEVVNGDFATDSNWDKLNATINNGKATVNVVDGAFSFVNQDKSLTSGKTFKLTAEVKGLSSSSGKQIKFQDKSNNTGGLTSANGTITLNESLQNIEIYWVANSNSAQIIISRVSSGTYSFEIDNVSVKEYLGQEVVPDSGCGSWLLEGQSTNLITYSEDFSQWYATGSTTIESGYLAPDGTNSAHKVSGSGSTLQFDNITNQTDTRTIYARTISGSGSLHLCSFNGNTNNLFTITEQWQRFEVNGAISTGASTFYAVDFRGSSTLTEVILWGAQLEQQSYATSYIPTNGAIATRLADVATNSGNASLINSTEGVLYAEIAALANDGTNRTIALNKDTNDRIQMYFNTSDNSISVFYKSQGTHSFIMNETLTDATEFNKIAFKWKTNDFALWVNGTETDTVSSGVTSNADTLNALEFEMFNNSSSFYGNINCVAVYKEALTDAELQSLTTI